MLGMQDQIIAGIATLVLAAACIPRTVVALRFGAIGAATLALVYALFKDAVLVAGAQACLIAVNGARLFETHRLHAQVRTAREEAIDPRQFEEHFRSERHERGDTLFLKGNPGNYAYYVASGEISIPEVAAHVGPGEFFGEFSLFTDGGLRTASAVCRTDVELYRIDSDMLAATFRRKPDFAFALVRLIVQRMSRNNNRLYEENAKLRIDRQLAGPRSL